MSIAVDVRSPALAEGAEGDRPYIAGEMRDGGICLVPPRPLAVIEVGSGDFGELTDCAVKFHMMVVMSAKRMPLKQVEDGVVSFTVESSDVHAVSWALDPSRDLGDVLEAFELDDGFCFMPSSCRFRR